MGGNQTKDGTSPSAQPGQSSKKGQGNRNPEIEEIVSRMTTGFTKKSITLEEFKSCFPQPHLLVEKLFIFSCNFNSSDRKDAVEQDALRMLLELLLLDPGFHSFDKTKALDLNMIEVFTSVYLNSLSDKHKNRMISTETAVDMLVNIVELIACSPATADSKKGLAGMFDKEKKEMTCDFFYSTFRDNFEQGRHALREGFRSMFNSQKAYLPSFETTSASIMDSNVEALVRLASNKMPVSGPLQCLFNSLRSGSSFNRLAFALVGYPAPTVLFIRHTYETTDGQSSKGLIGALVCSEWKDELGYWGDNQVVLFTLLPKVRFLYSYKGKGGNNFVYLNTKKISNSKYKVGLGFGGQEYRNFRIWLDDDILDKSATYFDDTTFPVFSLNEGYDEKLKIDCIEAWGFGDEEALAAQNAYRDMRQAMIHNSRKIDKKKLMEGDIGCMALSKNFAFRDQVDGDLQQMKEEAGYNTKK
jgi:hypothetical protein